MRAMTYHGAHKIKIETVPDPIIEQADDIILRVTATAICGSDLHLYRGKIPTVEHGDIFGHEFMGIVEDVGRSVTQVQRGDRVVIPFVIACGDCFFCQQQLYAACETTNDGRGANLNKKSIPPGAALFGYSRLVSTRDSSMAFCSEMPSTKDLRSRWARLMCNAICPNCLNILSWVI